MKRGLGERLYSGAEVFMRYGLPFLVGSYVAMDGNGLEIGPITKSVVLTVPTIVNVISVASFHRSSKIRAKKIPKQKIMYRDRLDQHGARVKINGLENLADTGLKRKIVGAVAKPVIATGIVYGGFRGLLYLFR